MIAAFALGFVAGGATLFVGLVMAARQRARGPNANDKIRMAEHIHIRTERVP